MWPRRSSTFHRPTMRYKRGPNVADAHGDISSSAQPCSAMQMLAPASQREDQVARRIQRLHRITASVAVMRAADIIVVAGLRETIWAAWWDPGDCRAASVRRAATPRTR